jgi:hypothetical protein
MQIIFWMTLMKRRLGVRVPRLSVLEHVAGMSEVNLSLNLRQLAKMRLLQIIPMGEAGTEIVLLTNTTLWDVGWL